MRHNEKEDIFKTDRKLTKHGVLKIFSSKKGYGFIHSNQTTKDVFVHSDEIKGKIALNDAVVFDLNFSEKGLIAQNVRRAS